MFRRRNNLIALDSDVLGECADRDNAPATKDGELAFHSDRFVSPCSKSACTLFIDELTGTQGPLDDSPTHAWAQEIRVCLAEGHLCPTRRRQFLVHIARARAISNASEEHTCTIRTEHRAKRDAWIHPLADPNLVDRPFAYGPLTSTCATIPTSL